LAEELVNTFATRLGAVVLVPSSGGVFEVTAGDQVVFSKRATGRFPEEGEVVRNIEERKLLP